MVPLKCHTDYDPLLLNILRWFSGAIRIRFSTSDLGYLAAANSCHACPPACPLPQRHWDARTAWGQCATSALPASAHHPPAACSALLVVFRNCQARCHLLLRGNLPYKAVLTELSDLDAPPPCFSASYLPVNWSSWTPTGTTLSLTSVLCWTELLGVCTMAGEVGISSTPHCFGEGHMSSWHSAGDPLITLWLFYINLAVSIKVFCKYLNNASIIRVHA